MGWNGSGVGAQSSTNNTKAKKQTSGFSISGSFKGVFALIIVLLIGAGAYWFVANDEVKAKITEKLPKGSRIAEVAADIVAPMVKEASGFPRENVQEDIKQEEKVVERPKTIYELRPDIDWDAMTNRTFSTGTEQLLSWICHTTPGEMALPLPPLSPEEKQNMAAILISRNEIKDTDSEDIAEVKESVEFAKKELRDFIKEGGNPDDFFAYYDKAIKDAFEKRNSLIEELQAMQSDDDEEGKERDPEVMREMVKKVNEALDEEGIKPITYNEETDSIY